MSGVDPGYQVGAHVQYFFRGSSASTWAVVFSLEHYMVIEGKAVLPGMTLALGAGYAFDLLSPSDRGPKRVENNQNVK